MMNLSPRSRPSATQTARVTGPFSLETHETPAGQHRLTRDLYVPEAIVAVAHDTHSL